MFYHKVKELLFYLTEMDEYECFQDVFAKYYKGYGIKEFKDTLYKVADYYNLDGKKIEVLKNGIMELENYPVILLPNVEKTLELLEGKEIYVVTNGMYSDQKRKLELCGLSHFFVNIVVLENKNIEEWLGLYKTFQLRGDNIEEILVVGNSLNKDILPNQEIGVSTIWLDHKYNYYGRDADFNNTIVKVKSWKQIYEGILEIKEKEKI